MTTTVLGATADPVELVPGDPGSVSRTVAALRDHGNALQETAAALGRVDRAEGWTGPAADGFRSALDAEPARWHQAGDAFRDAAAALDRYREVLEWAQTQAAEAARLWQEGVNTTTDAATDAASVGAQSGEALLQAAADILTRARDQLTTAGDGTARIVEHARDLAPKVRKWPEEVGAVLANFADDVVDADGALGDRALRNPAATFALGATGAVGIAGIAAALSGAMSIAGAGGPSAQPPVAGPWSDPTVREKLPAGWGAGRPNGKGSGWRWFDPVQPGRAGVRIDQGVPTSPWASQRDDHVIVRDQGRVIGRNGQPIPGAIKEYPEDAHIPFAEWKQWRSWNHP